MMQFIKLPRLLLLGLILLASDGMAWAQEQSRWDMILPDGRLGFGSEGLPIPDPTPTNGVSPRTVQLLGEELARSGQDVSRRVELTKELGLTHRAEASPFIEKSLRDASPLVRAEAAKALRESQLTELLPQLKALLSDPEPFVVRTAVVSGAAMGDAEFATTGLSHADAGVRIAAMRSASSPRHADAIAAAFPSLSPQLRIEAVKSLGRTGASSHSSLVASLLDEGIAEKVAALDALGAMKATDQLNRALPRLEDAHPSVRRAAILALQGMAPEDVRQARSIEMLSDSDYSVRTAAAEILRLNPTPAAVEPLVEQLSIDYQLLHDATRGALVAIGAPTIPAAGRLLDDADPRRQEDGSYLLGTLKSDEAIQRHIDLLKSPDWRVVAQAAWSLGSIGNPAARDPVGKLAARAATDWKASNEQAGAAIDAFRNAIIAAVQLGYPSIVEDTRKVIPDKLNQPSAIRSAALWAWGMMGDPKDSATVGRIFGIYRDIEDGMDVKIEGIKALGNLRVGSSASNLLNILSPSGDSLATWIATWSYNRITGEDRPFDAGEAPWSPSLSIMDLTPAAR